MTEKYVIIGDGVAGATAAEKLRKENEDAETIVFTDEEEPLYNRIMLKTYMKGSLPKQYTRMHDRGWYEKRDIKLFLDTRVESIDTESNNLETRDGEIHSYDKILVATGGSPRRFPADNNYDNVHYMWTIHDAENIKNDASEAEKAVVIGGGLLGIDLAMAYAENGTETDYVIRGSNWWSRGLNPEGAEIIHERLEDKGCNVVTDTEIEEFETKDGEVVAAVSSEDERFECDSVAVAIGQTPNSSIIDVEKNEYGMVQTDKYLQTSDNDVYAAGNMVEYDSPIFGPGTVNGSWDHSEAMGEAAAHNMLGEKEEFDYVNTYGVGHFDAQFLAIGDWTGEPLSRRYDDDHYRRLFFDGDRLVGAVMIGFTKGQEKIREMIQNRETVEDRERLLDKEYWD